MYPLYYFHIQLNENGPWRTEIGYSIGHIMADLATVNTMPYAYVKGEKL